MRLFYSLKPRSRGAFLYLKEPHENSSTGRARIESREGVVLSEYKDSAGILTIGVGLTSAAVEPRVTAGLTITTRQASEILSRDLAIFVAAVNASVKVPLNQNEFDALVSLAFNIGAGAFKGSTLLRKLNAGDRKGAADQFLVWNKITVNGKKQSLRGLTTRREAERKQFLSRALISATTTTGAIKVRSC